MPKRTLAVLVAIVLVIIAGTVMIMKRSISTGPGSIDAREAAATGSKPPPRKP